MFKNSIKVMSMILLAGLVIFSSCKKDDDTDDTPPVVILDGVYVIGGATAYTGYNANAMMAITRNEVNQLDREGLYELYIPLKANAGGFNISQVAGAVTTVYGPGADFAAVTNPTTDEPKDATIMRGSTEQTATVFTVDADGMYQVVIDMNLMIVTYCQVHWGVIGAATPDGWGTSTVLTESAFNAETMEWSINDMELRGGDWKFRYSNGWKIELDTTTDVGNGDVGVKVNTNLGGAVDALVAGGDNIVNDAPGVYTIEIGYVLGSGWTASATKTGDLPLTNWTDVVCDAVGSGVSIDNPDAIPDPSSWGWGNQLVASNGGIPTQTADEYTWTWDSVILEANEGFKLRTLNGVAPPVGGANFDSGYTDLDIDASSPNVVDAGGNLSVTTKAAYSITLTIDAANNDTKRIVIVEL
jgi:hypothetical protein